jgi:hypothetical protein
MCSALMIVGSGLFFLFQIGKHAGKLSRYDFASIERPNACMRASGLVKENI